MFLNLDDVKPTPEEIIRIMNALSKTGQQLIPSTFQEFTAAMGTTMGLVPNARLRFANIAGTFEVTIQSERLDIVANADPTNLDLGSLDSFVEKAVQCFEAVIGDRGNRTTRLALVTNSMLPEMDAAKLSGLYTKFVTPFDIFEENNTHEWSVRNTTKIELQFAQNETCNIISAAQRAQGTFVSKNRPTRFDRILFEIDINTVPEKTLPRFSVADARNFFSEALPIQSRIESSLLQRLNS